MSLNKTADYWIHRLALEMEKTADKILIEKLGIPFKRGRFLAVLLQAGTITQHNLATALGFSDPAVSNMLVELSKAGYVTIKIDPGHARKRLVALTEKGKTITIKGTQLLNQHFKLVMAEARVNEEEYCNLTKRIFDALAPKKL
jgi:DNA-binding MarR family transcriptional regulator